MVQILYPTIGNWAITPSFRNKVLAYAIRFGRGPHVHSKRAKMSQARMVFFCTTDWENALFYTADASGKNCLQLHDVFARAPVGNSEVIVSKCNESRVKVLGLALNGNCCFCLFVVLSPHESRLALDSARDSFLVKTSSGCCISPWMLRTIRIDGFSVGRLNKAVFHHFQNSL